ncbi:MAG: Hsp20/alpha crystallin family protein [Chloroflexota bacterium]|jgi:HSP20 family protein
MLRRTYNGRSVWQEMEKMRRDLDRMSDGFMVRRAPAFPALNVWTNAEGVLVTAEVPGVAPEALDIAIVDKTLTLRGSRQPEGLGDAVKAHRQERGSGDFNRTLMLPYRIEADQIEATFKNGVLTITLPRAEEEKPKKIAVHAA